MSIVDPWAETDEDIERRLLAEIAARSAPRSPSAAPTAQPATSQPAGPAVDDANFDAAIASLAGPRVQEAPETPREPLAPRQDPEWARRARLAPATTAGALSRGASPDMYRQIGDAVQRPTQMAEQRAFDRDVAEQRRLEAEGDEQARREARRRRILRGLGLGLGLMGAGNLGAAFAAGSGMVRTDGADQRNRARSRIDEMMALRERQRASRAEAQQRRIGQLLEDRRLAQRQGNADRDYELRRSGQALIDADRDAMRAQQREIFGLREAQDLQQDASRFAAADQRSRRHANAIRPGAGGRAVDPPDPNAPPATADDVERQIDELRTINDIGVTEIEAYLQQRGGVDTTSEEGRRRLLAVLAQNRRHLEDPDSRQAGAFWDNIRTSEGTGLRTANTEAAATAALSDQARGFGEAADALEEMQRQLGPIGSRLARSEGFMGAATAAMGGPEVEAARAAFRDTLSNLLHERGGASLTPAEKQIIEDALASGSFITSPEATVRQLRAIQRRLEQRRADRSVRPRSAPAASAAQPAASGRYRAGQVITGPGGQRVTLTQEQADRLNARGQ